MSGIRDGSLSWERPRSLELGGRRALVVGGTNGLGRALARTMAARGASVLVVGRTFRDAGVAGIEHLAAHLASMRESERVGRELARRAFDVVVMTTGIMAAPAREETLEGIERDLAVSYLNRWVVLEQLAPALEAREAGARVFVMGFPGTGQAGDPDDLNAERAYAAFAAHMNTVAGNEALVLDGAQRYRNVSFFGLNPGLVKTDIRANYMGEGSFLHRVSETFIGLFMPSADTYAERVVPLLFARELEGRTGMMFDSKGNAILPSAVLTAERVGRFMASSRALAARARTDATSRAYL